PVRDAECEGVRPRGIAASSGKLVNHYAAMPRCGNTARFTTWTSPTLIRPGADESLIRINGLTGTAPYGSSCDPTRSGVSYLKEHERRCRRCSACAGGRRRCVHEAGGPVLRALCAF